MTDQRREAASQAQYADFQVNDPFAKARLVLKAASTCKRAARAFFSFLCEAFNAQADVIHQHIKATQPGDHVTTVVLSLLDLLFNFCSEAVLNSSSAEEIMQQLRLVWGLKLIAKQTGICQANG